MTTLQTYLGGLAVSLGQAIVREDAEPGQHT